MLRSDQRRWAEIYIRGLLSVDGRKTMRKIAGHDGGTIEQSLQQFISKSPWKWVPVRHALARHLDYLLRPQAWIVEPLVIPKSGAHSVGVERQFVPRLGKVTNCQQSVGIWLASERVSCPIDWQLALPPQWTSEPEQRDRAAIPGHVRSLTPTQCAVDAIVNIAEEWGLRRQPVVMEVHETDLFTVSHELASRSIPFILRVSGSTTVRAAGPEPAAGGEHWVSARHLLESLKSQLNSLGWPERNRPYSQEPTALLDTRVCLPLPPGSAEGRSRPFVLLGAWVERGGEYWISNIDQLPPAALFRAAGLTQRVAKDLTGVCRPLGIGDFEGRSFRGWHHHVTLVSVAQAITMIGKMRGQPVRAVPPR
nr:transposase [Planobispora rosea]